MIYTIGHGNKPYDTFVAILKTYHIQALVDIRSYPMSRRNPHFNREALENDLTKAGVAYEWFKGLGGYRKNGLGTRSPHVALKSQGFRNYADHMLSRAFQEDIHILLQIARRGNTCIMCAETLPFRCHRWLLSDYLIGRSRGVEVIHIIDAKKTERHTLSKHARIQAGNVFYDCP